MTDEASANGFCIGHVRDPDICHIRKAKEKAAVLSCSALSAKYSSKYQAARTDACKAYFESNQYTHPQF